MKVISLSQNKVALVDDEDFELLSKYTWCACKNGHTFYAQSSTVGPNGKWTTVMMHRVILGVTDRKIFVDHKDHDGLNNQKYNLRTASHSQNTSNRISKPGSKSRYLGVTRDSWGKKWRAVICKNKKAIRLGSFKDERDAAIAYNNAAVKIHGEFANLNKVTP